MTKKQAERKKETPKIYVGPTIEGMAIQNVVYNNGIPDAATEAIKEEPAIASLFLPLERFSMATSMLSTGKGYIFEAFIKALEYKKRKKGNEA